MSEPYDPQAIEEKWRRRWQDQGAYEVDTDDPRPPYYVLCMYPYPSGPAHMGHVRNYTFGDLLVRQRTMQGYGVLSPIGFDSFGLPAENAAIKTGIHPRLFTEARIEELKASLKRLGAVYDWRREIRSHDPLYMRWNQVIFQHFLDAGLAYRKNAPVNWCPGCQTVLANEQVLPDGTCERSGDLVVRRDLEQWFFRITAYADELLDALDGLDWPERVKTMQRNWIGRSEGAEFVLDVAGAAGDPARTIRVFTTRPDTSFGMTFVVLAPEHPLVGAITTDERRADVEAFVERVRGESEIERQSSEGPLEKRGVFTGAHAVNPFTGREVPIFLADYVLMTYGTGAIMAVPAEDQRDWDFAIAHGLPIVRTVQPPAGWDGEAYTGDGPRIHSEWLDGITSTPEAKAAAVAWLEERGIGERAVRYRLRDWLLSRQRYWGCPIPVVHCPVHGIVKVPGDQLPILLPDDVEFRPTGESPLRYHAGFLHTTCPVCGGPAERETDTMDTFVDSSWYFERLCDPWTTTAPV
ncbi:MAG: leucine--tRNA ligase, partial [Acidimicrobiales bacterium]